MGWRKRCSTHKPLPYNSFGQIFYSRGTEKSMQKDIRIIGTQILTRFPNDYVAARVGLWKYIELIWYVQLQFISPNTVQHGCVVASTRVTIQSISKLSSPKQHKQEHEWHVCTLAVPQALQIRSMIMAAAKTVQSNQRVKKNLYISDVIMTPSTSV